MPSKCNEGPLLLDQYWCFFCPGSKMHNNDDMAKYFRVALLAPFILLFGSHAYAFTNIISSQSVVANLPKLSFSWHFDRFTEQFEKDTGRKWEKREHHMQQELKPGIKQVTPSNHLATNVLLNADFSSRCLNHDIICFIIRNIVIGLC